MIEEQKIKEAKNRIKELETEIKDLKSEIKNLEMFKDIKNKFKYLY